ncbi:MAG: lysostaphin resistance A-like protein [Planctomycetota bacterium]
MAGVCLIATYGLVQNARSLAGQAAAPADPGPQGTAAWALLATLFAGALLTLCLRGSPGLARLAAALRAPRQRVPWTTGLFLVGFGVFTLGELLGLDAPRLVPPTGDAVALTGPRTVVDGADPVGEGHPLARVTHARLEVRVEAVGPGVTLDGEPLPPGERRVAPSGSVLAAGPHELRVVTPSLTRVLGGSILGRLAGLLAFVLGLRAFAPTFLARLGLRLPRGRELLRGALAWLATLPLYAGAVALGILGSQALGVPGRSHELVLLIQGEADAAAIASALALAFVLAAILAPLKEELLLRGILLPALGAVWGPRAALLASATLFAVIHLSLAALLPMFVLGLLFGGLRLTAPEDDPLSAAICAHVLHNGTTLALVALGLLAR